MSEQETFLARCRIGGRSAICASGQKRQDCARRAMADAIHLCVTKADAEGKTRRVATLCEHGRCKPVEIFYEMDWPAPLPSEAPLDAYVLAPLLYVMSRGKPLRVHGALSHAMMRNLAELQRAWSKWRPDLYREVAIIPDSVRDFRLRADAAEESAIAAFSGGVDASFTAIRHGAWRSDPSAYPLKALMMVHGFDVCVYNHSDFKRLTERVKPLAADLGLELRTVRTNSRDLKLQEWRHSHGLELAACLHLAGHEFQYGMIGSSAPYDSPIPDCGSNPITDHLLSGDRMALVHDGAGFSRTEKLAAILKSPTACKTLKVCWAGADQSCNCGVCEKCLRTQLGFMAAGATATQPAFSRALTAELIENNPIPSLAALDEYLDMLRYAEKHGTAGWWSEALTRRVESFRPIDPAVIERRKNGDPLKRFTSRALKALGLDEPAKKRWRSFRRSLLKMF